METMMTPPERAALLASMDTGLENGGSFTVRNGESTSACETQQRVEYEVVDPRGRRCALLPPLHSAALRCLDGKPITFLGTSVTRYQYLSFVHFIDRGEFPPRCTSAHAPGTGPPPLEFGMPGPYTEIQVLCTASAQYVVLVFSS